MNNQYYPNDGMECVRSSLANLLVELNDPSAAQAVYDNFRRHELVNSVGTVHSELLPRVMKDLTQEKYDGVIYCHFSSDPTQELIKTYGGQFDDALKAILEDRSTGAIQTAPSRVSGSCPVIFGIEPKSFPIEIDGEVKSIPYQGNEHHVIVMKNSDTFIDNGFEMRYDISDLEVVAVIEFERAKK